MRVAFLSQWQKPGMKVQASHLGQRIASGLYVTLGGAVAATAIALLVYDVLRGGDFVLPWDDRATKGENSPEAGEEIRHYSEFVTVEHKALNLSITTGIRYDNSADQNIEAQWCYARKNKSGSDGFAVHLTIQEIRAGETLTFAPFSIQTLREFGLTQAQAKGLADYCRFK